MLQKSSREESLGCLFGIVVGFIGCVTGWRMDAAATAAMRAAIPPFLIDFLPVMPFWGMFLGGLFGTLFGMILSRCLPTAKPGAKRGDALKKPKRDDEVA